MSVHGYIVDEAEVSESHYPGSSRVSKVVNVQVTTSETSTKKDAIAEAYWIAKGAAEGDLDTLAFVGCQDEADGLDAGTYLVSHRIEYVRFW